MSLSGSREKDKFLPFLCKYLSRKKIPPFFIVIYVRILLFHPLLQVIEDALDHDPVLYVIKGTEPHEGSDFGGYPSLKQRNESFYIKESMTVHCGCFLSYQANFQHEGVSAVGITTRCDFEFFNLYK